MAESSPGRPRRRPSDAGVRADPRPGAMLGAAAATTLAVAVLLASGALPWGPRLVLGLALTVLAGLARAGRTEAVAARLGAPLVGALRIVLGVGGPTIAVAAVVSHLDGVALGSGGPSPVASVAILAVIALAFAARGPSGSRAAGTGAGVAAALAASALLDGIGLALLAWAIVLVPAAMIAVVVAALARSPRLSAGWAAASAVWLALVVGGGAGLGALVTGLLPEARLQPPGIAGDGVQTVLTIVALATAIGLASVAAVRRDLAGGLLAGSVLLAVRIADVPLTRVGLILVPVVVAATAAAALARPVLFDARLGRIPRYSRDTGWGVGPDVLRAAAGAAMVVLAVVVQTTLGDHARLTAAVGALLFAGALALVLHGRAASATAAGAVLGAVILVGLGQSSPWHDLFVGDSGTGGDHADLVATLTLVIDVLIAAVLLRRLRHPAVLAAAAYLVPAAFGEALLRALSDARQQELAWVLGASTGPLVLGAAIAGGVALLGRTSRVRPAQAAGAALVTLGGLAVFQAGGILVSTVAVGSGDVVDGVPFGARLVAAAAVIVLLLAMALLAASTARRRSVPAVAALVPAAIGAATALAALGASTDLAPTAVGRLEAADLLFGLSTTGTDAGRAGEVWPVLLGLVGLVLVLAAVALERLRPRPASVAAPTIQPFGPNADDER